jgi:hypothetical protein
MARHSVSLDGFVDPSRLYRWPQGVQRATGLSRKVYRLCSGGGLTLLIVGRSKYARGADVIRAIEKLAREYSDDPDSAQEALSNDAALEAETEAEQSAFQAAWSVA